MSMSSCRNCKQDFDSAVVDLRWCSGAIRDFLSQFCCVDCAVEWTRAFLLLFSKPVS